MLTSVFISVLQAKKFSLFLCLLKKNTYICNRNSVFLFLWKDLPRIILEILTKNATNDKSDDLNSTI